jgi:hypothetical protein
MGKRWTEAEDKFLTELRRAGTTYEEIATIMTARTAQSCQQRAHQLGLTKKRKEVIGRDASYPIDHEHNFLKPKPKPSWWRAMMWWRT